MRSRLSFALMVAAGMTSAAFAQESSQEAAPERSGGIAPAHVVVPVQGDRQHLPIMTIDQERLFLGSAWGRRAQTDLDTQLKALSEENDRLVAEFAREEQELTQLRQTLPAEEFRARANEFDKRVVEVRRERDAKGRELQQIAEEERDTFLQAALPILAQMMREKGAVVVLDQRMIFVSADAIDVTADLIARVDEEAGPGPVPKNMPAKSEQGSEPAGDAPSEGAHEPAVTPPSLPEEVSPPAE